MPRHQGRQPLELRPIRFSRGFISSADGSCLAECGDTRVICTASIEDGVPPWLQGRGQGWLTAEYDMLPASTDRRKPRDARRGRLDGRTVEIQRLVGRALRPAVDLGALGEVTVYLDCDVIQADGGTRTTAINGAWVALHDALAARRRADAAKRDPRLGGVAAVSVGVVSGAVLLDLDYAEDRQADADMNVVMDHAGRFLEVQASAERAPFDTERLMLALDAARIGIATVLRIQAAAVEADRSL